MRNTLSDRAAPVRQPAIPSTWLIIAMLLATGPAAAGEAAPILERARAPEQLEADLERSTGSVVLLHFWASWCIPCRDEMTDLARFRDDGYESLAEDGLRVVTISNDVRDRDLERFADKVDLVFPVYYDPYSKLTGQYGVRGLPSTIVLDRDGNVIEQLLGPQEWSSEAFQERLRGFIEPLPGIDAVMDSERRQR